MLAAAHHHFRHKVRSDMLAAPLAAIETALGTASLEAGDADAAARLWSLSWPAALDRRAREAHADVRDRAAMAAAFRLGRDRAGGRGARGHPSEPRRVRAAGAHRRRSRRTGAAPSLWGGLLKPATDLVVSFAPPDIGDAEMRAVVEVLQSGWLTTGPKVKAFEAAVAAYTGAQHAVAVNSGTAALHLSLLAAGIEAGREVVTTPYTFCATVNAIIHAGGTPVLADIDLTTLNLDPAAVDAAITPRTAALLPVHFAGRPAPLARLGGIARASRPGRGRGRRARLRRRDRAAPHRRRRPISPPSASTP